MLMDIEAAQDAETIARLKKEKHDLKFELRQQRQRIDRLEEELIRTNRVINDLMRGYLEELQAVTVLINLITKLVKKKEEKK